MGNPYVNVYINNKFRAATDYVDSLNPVYDTKGEYIIADNSGILTVF